MNRRDFLAALPASLAASQLLIAQPNKAAAPITVAANDWPWWRGPSRDGVAAAEQKLPLEWSSSKNIVWEAAIPGRGHGSPIVAGERVVLATADEELQVQSVLCFDRKTGKQLWQAEVHKGEFAKGGNTKSSHASSTPACDGERVFINFLNGGAIHTTALDLNGKRLWQTKVSDYVLHQGFGSSPAVTGELVIVSADNKGGGLIAGLERATGKKVWERERPKAPNYASPIIVTVGGKEQLILIGCDLVTSLDPLTGKEIWETKGATTECVTSTVTDGKHIFTSGGYPRNHVAAVKIDGSGTVVWENKTRVYVPSMLMRNGHLYAVLDDGFAVCWKSDTGTEIWKGRLAGAFTASPVLVGENILAINESGKAYIFKASPDSFDLVAENRLGDEVFASPAVCGGRIYLRVAVKEKNRRAEKLFCVGVAQK
jgi:outer membrane protein assembly factor BamB